MAIKIHEMIDSFETEGVLNHWMDLTRDDIMKADPTLTDMEAADLYCALQNRKEFGGIDLKEIDPKICKEYLMETLHNSCDGWRSDTIDTIYALMYDLMRYARNSR